VFAIILVCCREDVCEVGQDELEEDEKTNNRRGQGSVEKGSFSEGGCAGRVGIMDGNLVGLDNPWRQRASKTELLLYRQISWKSAKEVCQGVQVKLASEACVRGAGIEGRGLVDGKTEEIDACDGEVTQCAAFWRDKKLHEP